MVKERLQEIFRDVFEDNEIILKEEMTAEDIEDWDSLTHIYLIQAIEKAFDITFTLQETVDLETVGALINIIVKKMSFNDKN